LLNNLRRERDDGGVEPHDGGSREVTHEAASFGPPIDPVVTLDTPTVYGSFPTLFGCPLAESTGALREADVAFLGVPWSAPTTPSILFGGGTLANFEGSRLGPSYFRLTSLQYGGYLPEHDTDVLAGMRLVDRGDVDVSQDLGRTFAVVEDEIEAMLAAGCLPIVFGGNAGPTTYPFLKAVAARADGPTAVLNLDAHSDNLSGGLELDDSRAPRWAWTWALRILDLPGVDPGRYHHFGLRGPRNDRGALARFLDRGVRREHIYTYRELKQARRADFDEWAEGCAATIADGAARVWIALDPDVLDLGQAPDFRGTVEPLGPTTGEVLELLYHVARAAGRERFGGLAVMAAPHEARTLHHVLIYALLYVLAGARSSEARAGRSERASEIEATR
jgi:arginase family enzyme